MSENFKTLDLKNYILKTINREKAIMDALDWHPDDFVGLTEKQKGSFNRFFSDSVINHLNMVLAKIHELEGNAEVSEMEQNS